MANGEINVDALLPPEMAAKAEAIGIRKAQLDFGTMFALAVLAGAFIAAGAIYATTVWAGGGALPYGLNRLLGGLVFCLGLILVIVAGAELFTGNNLIVMAWANRKVSSSSAALRSWASSTWELRRLDRHGRHHTAGEAVHVQQGLMGLTAEYRQCSLARRYRSLLPRYRSRMPLVSWPSGSATARHHNRQDPVDHLPHQHVRGRRLPGTAWPTCTSSRWACSSSDSPQTFWLAGALAKADGHYNRYVQQADLGRLLDQQPDSGDARQHRRRRRRSGSGLLVRLPATWGRRQRNVQPATVNFTRKAG